MGNLTIPSFDGSSRCIARAWVQKLDTYFQLNPMMESKAIQFATLHLDDEAHEWWYYGLVTLQRITTGFKLQKGKLKAQLLQIYNTVFILEIIGFYSDTKEKG